MKTKYMQFLAALSAMALLFPLSALARDRNERSVTIPDTMQVGSTRIAPGNYQLHWQGDGPAVQVSFEQNGKTVATVPGTLKMNDDQITEDQILTDSSSPNTNILKEIDFRRQKEALVFDQTMNAK